MSASGPNPLQEVYASLAGPLPDFQTGYPSFHAARTNATAFPWAFCTVDYLYCWDERANNL